MVSKESKTRLVAALTSGTRPWETRDVPSDHYIFAGEIPWHPNFAFMALAEHAYCENVRIGGGEVEVEVLAHDYAWESYHSEMNRAGNTRVPSQPFSSRFDLHGAPQVFDQFLPDGSRATITLSGVDGLDADILYVREDLLQQYVGDRAIVWFAFGERELRPYPPSPPQWLVDAQRQQANAWHVALTEADIKQTQTRKTQKKVASKISARAPKEISKKPAANRNRRTRKPS